MALTGSNQLFSANHKNKESEIIYEIKWKEELSLIKKQTYCIIPINRRGQTNMVTLNSTTRCETAMENVELFDRNKLTATSSSIKYPTTEQQQEDTQKKTITIYGKRSIEMKKQTKKEVTKRQASLTGIIFALR